ncbi:hypothetical protein LIER_27125 [Lithospermum erythrorhizon]|uniref:F-box domain-containing protein n=1 Tax=Lithospermum erythrorhizon TaxID=34254 RepID=A0AAV3RGS1_LITER
MSHIPQEVITEILSWAQVKTLLRFRCVCKSWCVLIDSQRFVKMHLNRTLKSSSDQKLLLSGHILNSADFDSIFETNIAKIEQIDPPVRCLPTGIQVIGCCNGLVCLTGTSYKHKTSVMLWNPSTRKSKELPHLDECITHYLGFGYDAVHDDYKVASIMQSEDALHTTLRVYSSRSNTFGKVQEFPYGSVINGADGVFAVGVLHWIVSSGLDEPGKWIVAFNLATETTQLVPQPDCRLKKGFKSNLAVLEGNLSLIYYYREKYTADIWIMKDYGKKESWEKIASIRNQILLEKNDEDLVCYDLEEKSAKSVELQGDLGLYFQYGVYSGSLVQLNSGDPTKGDDRGPGFGKQKKNRKRDNFLSTGFKLVL